MLALRKIRPTVVSLLLFGFLPFCPWASGRAAETEETSVYDYPLTGADGKEVTLAPYKGRILVVEFFATWCAPCRRDLPLTASLQDQYSSEKIAFVAVSADAMSKTAEAVPRFVAELGVKIPVLVGGPMLVDRFTGIEQKGSRQIVLPQTYVFGPDGGLLFRLVGERKSKKSDLAQELDQILKEMTS
jgi:thiol-disulfide isomerase/thioredoxin